MDAGLRRYEHRNQCPWCLRSRHIMFGPPPPCDGLMHPVEGACADTRLFATRCGDCGFLWITYDEDRWAALDPESQTALINAAYTETERQNRQRRHAHQQ